MNKFCTYVGRTLLLTLGGFLLYLLITSIMEDLEEKEPKSSSVIYYPRMYRH
jgi:hypothetical protein